MTTHWILKQLFALSFALLILVPAALSAPEEAAIPTKGQLVRQTLSRGGKYLRAKRLDEAIREFKKAISLDPQSAEAHMLLGYAYRVQGRYEMLGEAKAELRQALALKPTLVWARFYLAKIYVDFGRLEDADKQLSIIAESNPNIPQVLALLGEVKRQLGNPTLSIEHNRKALDLSPMLTVGHYFLGLAYLDLKQEEQALQELRIAASAEGANADVHLALGSLYLQQEKLDRAIQSFKKAIALDALRPESHLKLARCYRLKGQFDRALAELRQSLPEGKDVPHSPYFQKVRSEIFFEMGLVYEQKQKVAKAIEAYLRTLRLQPENADAHHNLAKALFQQREYPRALEHALRANELGSPIDPALLGSIHDKAKANQ